MSGPQAAASGAQGNQAIDLTNCDREPIHLISAIQPTGFLVAISTDWLIARVSENAPAFLGRPVQELLGKSLHAALSAEAVHAIRNLLATLGGNDAVERAFGLPLQEGGRLFDLAVHMAGHQVVIEGEPSEAPDGSNPAIMVRAMLGRLAGVDDLGDLLRAAALQVRALTGYDRVMIYRFHPDGSGEVVAEQTRGGPGALSGSALPGLGHPARRRAPV